VEGFGAVLKETGVRRIAAMTWRDPATYAFLLGAGIFRTVWSASR